MGGGAREHEEVEVNLLGELGWRIGSRMMLAGVGQEAVVGKLIGGGARVENWRD